jgi:putative restriction endonuclease
VTATADYKFKVSGRLREEYHNGKDYYRMEGSPIWMPASEHDRPKQETLEFHASKLFKD